MESSEQSQERSEVSGPSWVLRSAIVLLVGHVLFFLGALAYVGSLSDHAGLLPKWVLFAGRFHPMVLHTPVGVLYALLLIEAVRVLRPTRGLDEASNLLLAITASSATFAAVLGLFLGKVGGYNEETLFWHKWLGVALAAMCLLAATVKIMAHVRPSSDGQPARGIVGAYRTLVALSAFVLVFVGHKGGDLTHGSEYLFEHAPAWVNDLRGKGGDAEDAALAGGPAEDFYTAEIFPLLETYCIKCHGTDKQKGEYRVDTFEHLTTAGESEEPPIVAYQPMNSYLVELITLPEHEEGTMPPEGKTRMTAEETMKIIHWVADGAVGPGGETARE